MTAQAQLRQDLGALYLRGLLVPFVGAGMSRPVCRDWYGMIETLEQHARILRTNTTGARAADISVRAARALEILRLAHDRDTPRSVSAALLEESPHLPPAQTEALAAGHWPLVLTTNYDDLYLAAVHQRSLRSRVLARRRTGDRERRELPVDLLGRSSYDCHRVLTSLTYPSRPVLWALQGYLGGQAMISLSPTADSDPSGTVSYESWALPPPTLDKNYSSSVLELQGQLVVGHADYRRVTMQSEHFRRAFADVFRRRSLLFLGSGLADKYLIDLFSEIVDLYGASSQPHFAIAKRDELDAHFLRRYLGVWVLEIDSWDALPDTIRQLTRGTKEAHGPSRWHFAVSSPTTASNQGSLTLAAASLPPTNEVPKSTGIVLSGGGSQSWLRLSEASIDYRDKSGMLPAGESRTREMVGRHFQRAEGYEFVWQLDAAFGQPTVLAARPRLDPLSSLGRTLRPVFETEPAAAGTPNDTRGRLWRDIRLIRHATIEVLQFARANGLRCLATTVLGAGELSILSPSYSLLEMIRAWGSTDLSDGVSMIIHIVDPELLVDLRSGRLDPLRVLRAGDGESERRSIQFWLEIIEANGGVSRSLRVEDPQRPVSDLMRETLTERVGWTVDLAPAPCLGWAPWPAPAIGEGYDSMGKEELTLERFGVLHGSTVRIRQSTPPGSG
jgi:SIR2-like domain